MDAHPAFQMEEKKPVGAEELSPSVSVSVSLPMRSSEAGFVDRLYTQTVARPPAPVIQSEHFSAVV